MNTCSACGMSKLPMEHLSSVFLEANKWCLSVGPGQGWGCRQVKGIEWEDRAKRMLLQLHVHVLYEDLTDDPN